MRSAAAAARGTITNISAAISTEKRTSMMYCRNAERLPICIPPESTRKPPNQTTATVETFMMPKRNGIMIANSRLTSELRPREVEVGLVEAPLLVVRPNERPDDAHAAERLAHDLVDPVGLLLQRLEQRQGAPDDDQDHDDDHAG